MKKVTAVLLVYAILVIASCAFWVWSALSKSKLTAGSNEARANVAADADKMNQDAETGTDDATELTGEVMNDVTAGSQARRHGDVHDL
jgi:hypothetical protein